MSAPSKRLPNEMLLEMANYVPLKIVHKHCVVPAAEGTSLLIVSRILTEYLRKNCQKMLQFIAEMSSLEFYQNDEAELCVTMANGNAMSSTNLLRHICLNGALLQRKAAFAIKDHVLPANFKPIQFLEDLAEYATTCANPLLVADKIYMHFAAIDDKELPNILKKRLEKLEKKTDLEPWEQFFTRVITLSVENKGQNFQLRFCQTKTYASFCKVVNGGTV